MPRPLRPLLTLLLLLALAPASAGAQTPSSFGNADGVLRLPEALAVSPDGTVWVGDHFSGRIQPFKDGRPVAGAFGVTGSVCGRIGAVSGLAIGADGRRYVLDADEQRVHVFGPDGRIVRCFGRRGFGRGQLRTSSGGYAASTASGGIAVTRTHVWIADTGNNRVQRFSLDGGSPRVFAKGRVLRPQGIAVSGSRVLVADDGNHRVVELTTSGRFVRASRGGTGAQRLRFPYDVAFAARGSQLYVADNNGHRGVVLDRRLRRVRSFGSFGSGPGRFIYPRALAVDARGHVFVADPGNDRVTEHTAQGRYLRSLGINGRRTPRVSAPADVAVNGRGEVAVADRNMRISWFGLDGRFLGAWAQGKSFLTSTAAVNGPSSVAFAADDRLRVVDGGTLRDFAPGSVTTLLETTPFGRPVRGRGGPLPRAVDRDARTGVTWLLVGRGQLQSLAADGAAGPVVGTEDEPDRTSTDVAVLGDGSIAVPEGGAENRPNPADGTVRRFDAAGRLLSTWTLARPTGGDASKPAGVTSDGAGGAWVSDAANGRVVRFAPDGRVVATLGTVGGGPGELAVPSGLTLDCDGGLLVADTGNNRVVRFPGVGIPGRCAAPSSPSIGRASTPKPVDIAVRTVTRAKALTRALATMRVSCRRSCTIEATAQGSAYARGSSSPSLPVTVRASGRRLRITAGDATLRQMRAIVRRGGRASIGVTVVARAPDGVVDVDSAVLSFRR